MTQHSKGPSRRKLRDAAKHEPGGTGRRRGIAMTGNSQIDRATAEIAIVFRDAWPGKRDQAYYDDAERLRDEIMAGTRELIAGEEAQS